MRPSCHCACSSAMKNSAMRFCVGRIVELRFGWEGVFVQPLQQLRAVGSR